MTSRRPRWTIAQPTRTAGLGKQLNPCHGSTDTVYTNYLGETLLSELYDAVGNDHTRTFNYYLDEFRDNGYDPDADSTGQLLFTADPAAMQSYSEYTGYGFGETYVTLNGSAGLISINRYGEARQPTGYLTSQWIRNGWYQTGLCSETTDYWELSGSNLTSNPWNDGTPQLHLRHNNYRWQR